MRHRNILSSAFPRHNKAGRDPARPLYANSQRLGMGALFCLGRVLAEGGIDFVLPDAGLGISGLTEVLLFGAVAHHAGVRRGGVFFGYFLVGLVWCFRASPSGFA